MVGLCPKFSRETSLDPATGDGIPGFPKIQVDLWTNETAKKVCKAKLLLGHHLSKVFLPLTSDLKISRIIIIIFHTNLYNKDEKSENALGLFIVQTFSVSALIVSE